MKLSGKMYHARLDLVAQLEKKGFVAKQVHDGVIFDFPRTWETIDKNGTRNYSLPKYLRGALVRIDAWEEGGKRARSGYSRIICGLDGLPLRPYKVIQDKAVPNGAHAFFTDVQELISVRASATDAIIAIVHHTVVNNGDLYQIKTEMLLSKMAPSLHWECPVCGQQFDGLANIEHSTPDNERCDASQIDMHPVCTRLRLPDEFNKFQNACLAARAKAHCKECTDVHYAQLE